ncbi:MAG: glycosyltransferase family 4 protein [bacterium]
MAILSIFYKHKEGGFTRRLYSLYRALAQEGHDLYYLSSEELPVIHQHIKPCLVSSPLTGKGNKPFWLYFIFGSLLASYRITKKHHVRTIVNFGPFYTFLCLVPIKLRRIPAITFVRADNMKHSRNAVRNLFFYGLDWAGIRISHKVVFNSHTLIKTYQARYGIPEDKIHFIPNNITGRYSISQEAKQDIRQSMGVHSREFLVSTAGVFNPGKNFSYLIEAMEALHRYGIKLLIIGDEVVPNGERIRLKNLTHRLGLDRSVIFCGWQSDPSALVASSDAFVFPSRFEGSPNALLEALGCGVACLGARIDEIAEVLHYEELLFPLDHHEVLVGKIKRLRFDAAFRRRVAILSQKRCEHFLFDWEQEVLKIIDQDGGR